jgi:nitronate monooxygenase
MDLSEQMGTLGPAAATGTRPVRVPVIAAGGIADAAGVRAAMALGAAGVQVGTAYLCARMRRPPQPCTAPRCKAKQPATPR